MKSKLSNNAFLLFWVMFGTYYVSGIALSSFWQIWCKVAINGAFFILALSSYKEAYTKYDRLISLTATSFFAGITMFYLIAFLLFNFFELAINDYVGYTFLGLLFVCLSVSAYKVYGKRD